MTPRTDDRYPLLLDWLHTDLGLCPEAIEPASTDASFRRYFRVFADGASRIVMDAPPSRENVEPFVRVAALLRGCGVRTPGILAIDRERGFMLLDDLGHRDYLGALNAANADALYGDAMACLLSLQCGVVPAEANLPLYDERLLRNELGIFREWLLERFLGLELSGVRAERLESGFQILVESALEQPRVCVHRDFHSRNLMVIEADNPGVLDFQDAVIGPITYDLVSLLRDCYIDWPPERVRRWMEEYRDRLVAAGALAVADLPRFRRWFDLMGMQRHLKAAGIFARLDLRDGKPGYLGDIPRTLGYVRDVGRDYPELSDLLTLLDREVLPNLVRERRP